MTYIHLHYQNIFSFIRTRTYCENSFNGEVFTDLQKFRNEQFWIVWIQKQLFLFLIQSLLFQIQNFWCKQLFFVWIQNPKISQRTSLFKQQKIIFSLESFRTSIKTPQNVYCSKISVFDLRFRWWCTQGRRRNISSGGGGEATKKNTEK